MDLPTEWFASGAGKFVVFWRIDEDHEVQIDNSEHLSTIFFDNQTIAHMAALLAQINKEAGDE